MGVEIIDDKSNLERYGLKVKKDKIISKPVNSKLDRKIIRNIPTSPLDRRNNRIKKIKSMLEKDKSSDYIDDTRIYSFVELKKKNNGRLFRVGENSIKNGTNSNNISFVGKLVQKLNSKFKFKKKSKKQIKCKDSKRAKMLYNLKKEVK